MIFVTFMTYISKMPIWKLVGISCFQISQQLQGTLTTGFEDYSWRFYGHGSTYVFILSWINMMTWKLAKAPWKLLVPQKSEPILWRTLHQGISLIIIFFFFSETNLVFKFNLVVIEKFSLQLVYLFTFWYSVYLGVHPVSLSFFISKNQ